MNRYVVAPRRPKAEDIEYVEEWPVIPDLTVYEGDDYVDTGLCDERGEPIYRARNPVGYIWET